MSIQQSGGSEAKAPKKYRSGVPQGGEQLVGYTLWILMMFL